MVILFITLLDIRSLDEHNIYTDVMRGLAKNGNELYLISPIERRNKLSTSLIEYDNCDDWHKNCHILKPRIGNIQKTNVIEKGLSTIFLEKRIKNAVSKFFRTIKFDLILYSTPPITLYGVVKYIKKRDNAKTYLMLKDIFPQNSVDLGMLSKTGLKGFLYKYFRKKEKKLYAISDRIGCMSQANVEYVLRHNPEIDKSKVEIFPNCIEVRDLSLTEEERTLMRKKYGLPLDKKVFVYGGNLGKPQGIPFIIDCLCAEKDNEKAFFLIVGDGTEYGKLETFVNEEKPTNVLLLKRLPKEDYDRMIAACDVGLIFLDHRFTIPNFPSRLLSYMQAGLPVLAATDPNTDIGKVIVEGGFGWWCESNDVRGFSSIVADVLKDDCKMLSHNSQAYLKRHYSVSVFISKFFDN